ncbi:hypothetical protein [Niabella soli]|nr:hypothetical protein [Niabella soli]
MILKKLFLLTAGILCLQWMCAQTPEQKLDNWNQRNPIEKIYLHLDRESYISGQTIWLKAYCMSDYTISTHNSTIYVELLNSRSQLISRKIFPAYLGVTLGQIELPETLASGAYQVRAYSPLMLNQPGFMYHKEITVFGATAKEASKKKAPSIDLQFFPEGGNLVTTLLNTVAFKAVDQNGYPVTIAGKLKNSKGEEITTLASKHDGMGRFALVPQAGEAYYVALDNNPAKQYPLPAATNKGITFSITNSAKGKQFKIERTADAPEAFRPAYMIGQMQNQVIFKQPLKQDKDQLGGVIQTANLLSGILQVTVFNKDDMPLAERLTFVDSKEYILPGTISVDTFNNTAHQKNRFTLNLKDTVIGHFSISVTDADYETTDYRPLNIYSYFLLSSDLKGYINDPAYYFRSDASAVKEDLDLVMMTNGWTRFKWKDVVQNKLPAPQYIDPLYINLKGTVNIEGTRKPFANKDLLVMTTPVDSTQGKGGLMKMIKTDSSGRFHLDTLIFYDNTRILFSDIKGKKSKFIRVKMDADSLNRNYHMEMSPFQVNDSLDLTAENKMQGAYNDYLRAEGKTLANVTVKARQKTDQEKLESEYTSGLFSGGINSRILDLRNENPVAANIFDYIQGRLPGVTVSRDTEGQYVVRYRDGGFGNGKLSLYLDEMHTDATMIEGIPISQIAFIKLMGTFVGAPGGGGALAIYTKKGADLSAAIESSTDIITYKGYSIIKQFYQPNYDLRTGDNAKADNRLTLSWTPDMYLANINPKVPIVFYNNDRTKRFKIVVEGLTNDGRMLMLEKTIENGN